LARIYHFVGIEEEILVGKEWTSNQVPLLEREDTVRGEFEVGIFHCYWALRCNELVVLVLVVYGIGVMRRRKEEREDLDG
jgi:hypothetical protein